MGQRINGRVFRISEINVGSYVVQKAGIKIAEFKTREPSDSMILLEASLAIERFDATDRLAFRGETIKSHKKVVNE